jgi:hypothetical protein
MNLRLKLAAVWMSLQVALFGLWAATEASPLRPRRRNLHPRRGRARRPARSPSRPVLPAQFQVFAARYFNAELPTDFNEIPEGASVWVVLGPSGRYHIPRRVEFDAPANLAPDEIVVRGRKDGWTLAFGIERYFVPEGTETPNPEDLTVRLRVAGDGSVRIEEVLLNNRPWP